MQLTITLNENPTAEQVMKANRAIAFFCGQATMTAVAALLVPHEHITTDAPVAPPPPPPPPASAAAPVAPPPPPPVGAAKWNANDLDVHGLPWDERLHAGSKTKNKAGDWKGRKNLDDGTKMAVTAELRQFFPAPNAVAAAPVAPPPPPATAAAPVAPPPPPPAPGGATMTFVELAQKISPLLTSGKITQAQVVEACGSVGVPSLPALGQHPDKVAAVNAYIDSVVMMAG